MKTKKLVLQLCAIAGATSLVLTGCASNDGSSEKDTTKKEDAAKKGDSDKKDSKNTEVKSSDFNKVDRDGIKDGGTLTYGIYEIPEQQNVFHADHTVPTQIMWKYYNPQIGLFDENGKYYANPDYISSVEDKVVDGNTIVTFNIVPEAKWNDGTDIDWTAFETTWIINRGDSEDYIPASTDGYDKITSVKQGDSPKQVVVTFDGSWPWWQGLFNYIAHPALKDKANYMDYVKKVHPEWGAGPFAVESVDFNKGEAIFVRNDKWWGPKAKLDKVILRQMETQASLNAFKNGEIDLTGVGSKDRYAAVKDMDGIDIRIASTASNILLELNSKAPALQDKAVRKAIFEAIDRHTLGKIRFNGIPYEETPPGSLTLYPFQEGYQDNFSQAVTPGADNAKKTLADAGYKANSDGILEKDGKPLTVRYTLFGDSETSKATAQAIQKMLKDVGINAVIDQHPSSEFSDVVSNDDFDILPLGFSSSDPFGTAYFGQMFNSDSQLNKTYTGTKEFDAKIKELQALPTADEQIKLANKLEVEAFQLYGLFPYANGADMVAVKKGLANMGAMGFTTIPVENLGWAK